MAQDSGDVQPNKQSSSCSACSKCQHKARHDKSRIVADDSLQQTNDRKHGMSVIIQLFTAFDAYDRHRKVTYKLMTLFHLQQTWIINLWFNHLFQRTDNKFTVSKFVVSFRSTSLSTSIPDLSINPKLATQILRRLNRQLIAVSFSV